MNIFGGRKKLLIFLGSLYNRATSERAVGSFLYILMLFLDVKVERMGTFFGSKILNILMVFLIFLFFFGGGGGRGKE